MYTMTINPQFNSLEISFDGKPSEAVREALKSLRFRWHGVKKVWYGYASEDEVKKAIEGGKVEKTPAAKKETVNKFGVKVGDLFTASWGYEQTQSDFFQVIALVGDSSVRVVEVNPQLVSSKAVSPMSEDRTFKNTKELLPHASRSSFIKDQEKGDLKRLKSYAADGKSHPQFNLSSYASAHLCEGDTITVYESWYY